MLVEATGISAVRGGAGRRLSNRVLIPVAVGLVAVTAAASGAATYVARDQAAKDIRAQAETIRDVAQSQLRRTGRIGPVAAAARSRGASVTLAGADRPLPGGAGVADRGSTRLFTWTVSGRRGDARLTVAMPLAPVASATRRTLTVSLAAAALLALLALLFVSRALRRAAIRPLRALGDAVGRLSAREPTRVAIDGAREVRAVADRLDAVASVLVELESQATTDPLTGVGNRRSFHVSLEAEMKRATRDGRPLTLVIVDLDGFKEINDAHGHPFGDGVLQVVAQKIRAGMRATDVVARVGGDEFALLMPATAGDAAAGLVERARDHAVGETGGVSLTWSAGIASFPDDARDGETLVECADAALYCAKAAGSSGIYRYHPEQAKAPGGGDHAAVEALLDLPDAVVPVFQPLVSLRTGVVSGFEALARFPHPPARRPDEWFAIAGRCGLGPQLELKAVRAALASRGRPHGTYLSFNLSASALMSDEVLTALPHDLSEIVIEITENERVSEPEKLAERLEPLRARGARVAVDDAGAGYSGLQQVMRIQPDIIKLDRSLVANVDSDPAKAALIDSFVRFASRTGASVCAEGIETPEELKVLADLDVTYGQGFGLARPAAPWAEVASWVPGTLRARASSRGDDSERQENADLRLATLTSRLANVRSSEELAGVTTLMATEIAAKEVALLRRGQDPGTLVPVTDHRWLPAGSPLALKYFPTLRQVLASQEICQILDSDGHADLGELALLGRSRYRAMLLAPIVAQGEVVGLLAAFGDAERPWTRAETSRARIVGHQLGSVLDALAEPPTLVALPGADGGLPAGNGQGEPLAQ